jgi:hypothetical protein
VAALSASTDTSPQSLLTDWAVASPDLAVGPKDLGIVLEHLPNERVRAADEVGAGVTVISKLVAANSLKAGLLVAVAVDLPESGVSSCCYIAQAERELSLVVKGLDTRQAERDQPPAYAVLLMRFFVISRPQCLTTIVSR